jgi:hypothetical protein
MTTLAALEQYSALCDELDQYMHEENSHLRESGNDQSLLVDRKRQILEKLDDALVFLRQAGPVKTADHTASAEVRKRVLAKVLKLLLLSRESEQLLLKNSVRTAPRLETPQPTPSRLASTYKTQKKTRPASTEAQGSWSVW